MSLALLIDGPSNSGKVLAASLGIKRVRPASLGRNIKTQLINWGVANLTASKSLRVLNRDVSVSNKLTAFKLVADAKIRIPEITSDPAVAAGWAKTGTVLARSTATGSGGVGIKVVRKGQTVPYTLFYTKYIKKSAEYRLHVVNGKVIFTQQKRKKNDAQQDDDQALIRNHANGWVFAENKITYHNDTVRKSLEEIAVKSVAALGLDFAAVDLIVEKGSNNVFFLEANTKPGLESTRLIDAYTSAFRSYNSSR